MENETEKLNIDERKIIHILLKQLMYQQNEMAYIRNKAELNSSDNGMPEKNDSSNSLLEGVVKNNHGDKNDFMPVVENNHGDRNNFMPVVENNHGDRNDFWLYTAFEQELKKALEQYIKNGNGQNSLYSFYTNFEEAMEQKNTASLKIQEAAKNVTLEDTHILPPQITVDDDTIDELAQALQGHLPRTAPSGLYITVACELLHLYNTGMATGPQLRGFAGLSASGISKHLPKLQRTNLIKKQPPSNYVLTEKSIHILLETFGVEKN